MQEKLYKLFEECAKELENIGIYIKDNKEIGEIDIKIAPRATKRYGCCKQEKPDRKYYHKMRVRKKNICEI